MQGENGTYGVVLVGVQPSAGLVGPVATAAESVVELSGAGASSDKSGPMMHVPIDFPADSPCPLA
ncbi:MAG TPA: hypothetical protein VNE17_03235, partial [Nitrolancea sp.]|nr:hypothetical protein [Nitrolancea sp.]